VIDAELPVGQAAERCDNDDPLAELRTGLAEIVAALVAEAQPRVAAAA
jgi:hypothetical protein